MTSINSFESKEQVNKVRRGLLNLALNESNKTKSSCAVVIALNTPILRSGRRGHVVKNNAKLNGKYCKLFPSVVIHKTPVTKVSSSNSMDVEIAKVESASCETKAHPLEIFHLNPAVLDINRLNHKQRERDERHKAFEFLNNYANTFKALRHISIKGNSKNTNKEKALTTSTENESPATDYSNKVKKHTKVNGPKRRRHTLPIEATKNGYSKLYTAIEKLALEPIIKQ